MSAEMAEMQQSSALRELAAVPSGGGVISLYLDLDPSRFATEEARSTEVRSLLDEAARQIERLDGWSHDEREALKADLARIRNHFESGEFSAKGAHGLALFASRPVGLFEAVRMQRTVESGVFVDRGPRLRPLVEAAASPGWCVALVNRQTLRAFAGSSARLEEVEALSEHVHGQHDQGGWSQPRYQRSVDKEVAEHLRRSASVLARLHERIPFDHLLVGGPEEIVGDFEEALPPPLRDRLEGRVAADVENSNAVEVTAAAAAPIEEADRRTERELLDRLKAGVGGNGRAVAGLDDTLAALEQQRVEVLAFEEGAEVPEAAIRSALAQSAEIRVIRHHPDLAPFGGIGAVLRF